MSTRAIVVKFTQKRQTRKVNRACTSSKRSVLLKPHHAKRNRRGCAAQSSSIYDLASNSKKRRRGSESRGIRGGGSWRAGRRNLSNEGRARIWASSERATRRYRYRGRSAVLHCVKNIEAFAANSHKKPEGIHQKSVVPCILLHRVAVGTNGGECCI